MLNVEALACPVPVEDIDSLAGVLPLARLHPLVPNPMPRYSLLRLCSRPVHACAFARHFDASDVEEGERVGVLG